MTPTFFPEANITMKRPPSMPEEQCMDVKAFANGHCVITAWVPDDQERVKIAMGEPIYLMLWGPTMQPALLTANSPFLTAEAQG